MNKNQYEKVADAIYQQKMGANARHREARKDAIEVVEAPRQRKVESVSRVPSHGKSPSTEKPSMQLKPVKPTRMK